METTAIALLLAVLRSVVKNPKKKAALKKRLMAVRDAIDAAYADEN